MQLTARLRDRLIAADPGLTRLFMAARACLAVGVTLVLLLALARWEHLSLTVPLLGAALGMTWSIAVNDRSPRDQRLTTLLLWLPAAGGVTLGTFTAPDRALSDALFVCLVFVSIYVRKYGPRGFALGLLGVFGFFFALFLRASFAQLPWLIVALAVTTVVTYAIRFFLLPNSPQRAIENGVRAFRARQRLIADTIERARARKHWNFSLDRRLNHHLFRLNETALAIDDVLRDADASAMRAALLDAELETGDVAQRARADLHDNAPLPYLRLELPEISAQTWTPRGPFRTGTQIDTGRIEPFVRQAVQLALATAAAIAAGEALSPQRWYWAVLTAYVVFGGTASAGETLRKAWERVGGTALGVVAGIAAGGAVRGSHTAAFALMFVFLFITVYTFRISYAAMTLGITAVLSLLYVLLGLFSDSLMLLRLEETFIGAMLGGIAATFILPIRTRSVVSNVATHTLGLLRTAIDASVARLCGEDHSDLLAAVRDFDDAFQSIRAQLRPMIYALPLTHNRLLRSRLLLFAALGHHVRSLAIRALEPAPDCPPQALRDLQAHVHGQIDLALARINGNDRPDVPPAPAAPDIRSLAFEELRRIDRALHALNATYSLRR